MDHVKFKRSSQFTLRKRGQSRHYAMHHFLAITPIIFLFHKSRPEKRAHHAITPTAGDAFLLENFIFSAVFSVRFTHFIPGDPLKYFIGCSADPRFSQTLSSIKKPYNDAINFKSHFFSFHICVYLSLRQKKKHRQMQ